ncbi:response regulator transcription factor [Nocardioides pacificus]
MSTVLVVEDAREIRDLLRRYLERAGYVVLSTESGAEAIRLVGQGSADLVLLDLGLPDVDGTDVLRAARDGDRRTPVIVLTARSTLDDRIAGLSLGADDYVTKPFSPTEVVLRVRAVLSRAGSSEGGAPEGGSPGVRSYGGGRLVLDEDRHQALLDGHTLGLTPTEWGILTSLASVPGRPFSRYELVNRVRGYEFSGYERSIDSHVKNLRHKLGADGSILVETVTGVGYRLGLDHDR